MSDDLLRTAVNTYFYSFQLEELSASLFEPGDDCFLPYPEPPSNSDISDGTNSLVIGLSVAGAISGCILLVGFFSWMMRGNTSTNTVDKTTSAESYKLFVDTS